MLDERVCVSISLLTTLLAWPLFVAIVALSTGVIRLLRFLFERKYGAYDIAFSSTPGDLFLAGHMASLATFVQNFWFPRGGLHMEPIWHISVATISLLGGIALQALAIYRGGDERVFATRPAQWWHNLVVLPVLAYLVISTFPILAYVNDPIMWIGSIICVGTWVGLLAWDIRHGNLVQIRKLVAKKRPRKK